MQHVPVRRAVADRLEGRPGFKCRHVRFVCAVESRLVFKAFDDPNPIGADRSPADRELLGSRLRCW